MPKVGGVCITKDMSDFVNHGDGRRGHKEVTSKLLLENPEGITKGISVKC